MKKIINKQVLTLFLCGLVSASADAEAAVANKAITEQADHAVVLLYHHVADDTPPSTSISIKDFVAQLDHFESNKVKILPLQQIVATLRENGAVPDNAIAITFDDAYATVFNNAWPELKRRNLPFTVFVNTAAIKTQPTTYMSWAQLKELSDAGVTIGNHSHTHQHLVSKLRQPDWAAAVEQDITQAGTLLHKHLGTTPQLFAYPYGEFSAALQTLVGRLGLIGFGQHSGAIDTTSDYTALPRFPIGGSYSSLSRLDTAIKSRPLEVNADPANGVILSNNATSFDVEIHIADGPENLSALACYPAGGTHLNLTPQGNRRFLIQLTNLNSAGRHKINCTLPDSDHRGAFFWWSFLMMKPESSGVWYQQ